MGVEQDGTSSSHHRNRNRLSLGPSRQQGAQEDEKEVLQEEEIAEGEEKAQDLQEVEKEEESAEEKEVQEKDKGKEGQEIQEVQEEDLQTKEENEKAKKVHS